MNKQNLWVAILLSLIATTASAQSIDPQAIVDQFYPQEYVDDAASDNEELNRDTCYAVYQALGNGTPQLIVAGYDDGFQGTIKVITRQGSGQYAVLYEPTDLDLGPMGCSIELKDVDGDGINEIRVSFVSARGPSGDWIFKWDGSQLTSLGPVSVYKGITDTRLVSSGFVDY